MYNTKPLKDYIHEYANPLYKYGFYVIGGIVSQEVIDDIETYVTGEINNFQYWDMFNMIVAMPSRPSLEEVMMNTAVELSKRSTCQRLQVGCVITDPDMRVIYGIGYNGSYRGGVDKCDSKTPGNCGCSVHAEINALINLNAPRGSDKLVFVTHLCCPQCAKALVNLGGIKKVYYNNTYRKTDSLDIFAEVGIEVEKWDV